jgi:hypothetical protein
MNIETIGIGLLCVSQGCMWWRNGVRWRASLAANAGAMKVIDGIASDAGSAAAHGFKMREELREALARLPKRRNTRKPKVSPDPIGPVAS